MALVKTPVEFTDNGVNNDGPGTEAHESASGGDDGDDGNSTKITEGTQDIETTRCNEDAVCFRWKLHEKFLLFGKDLQVVMEVKTWEDASADYGSIDLHYIEIHTDSGAYFKDGK